MKLFFAAFTLALRRLLRRPSAIVLLAAMPVTALAAGLPLAAGPDGGSVLVGLTVPAGSARARAAADLLLSGGGAIRFVESPAGEPLENAVAAGTYDFGYRFSQDFDRHAADGEWRGAVTRVTTPASPFYPALDDRVAAAVLRACWPDFVQPVLARAGYDVSADTLAASVSGPVQVMELRVEAASGAAAAPDVAAPAGLLPGIMAIFLFTYTLLAVTDFTRSMQQGFFARLRPFTGTPQLFTPTLAATLLAGGLSAAAALLVSFCFVPPPPVGAVATLALLLLYTLYLAGVAVLLCALFARRVFPVAVIPFLAVACVVLCPLLLDIAALLPATRPFTALLPPTLFLRAVAGEATAALSLGAGTAVLGTAGAVIFRFHSRAAAWLPAA